MGGSENRTIASKDDRQVGRDGAQIGLAGEVKGHDLGIPFYDGPQPFGLFQHPWPTSKTQNHRAHEAFIQRDP
jgi:hypothetical protein